MEKHGNWDKTLPEQVLVCQWCDCSRFFSEKTKFSQHVCLHTGMLKFECPECDQKFTSETMLRTHLKRHRRSFKCIECEAQGIQKSYTSLFNLKQHIRSVHEQRPLVCPHCQQKYSSHKAWSSHTRQCKLKAEGKGKASEQQTDNESPQKRRKKVHLPANLLVHVPT